MDDPSTSRRPGRPVSAASRQSALDAATTLLDKRGLPGFSIDEVARRSGVSKATIYKHWTDRLDLASEAYGSLVTREVPVRHSGDVVADLLDQVGRLADAYAGPRGRVIAQLLAAGIGSEDGPARLRERFFGTRRRHTVDLVTSGIDDGTLRPDLDPQLVVDLVFGPIVFRLVNGESPLTPEQARGVASVALRGLLA